MTGFIDIYAKLIIAVVSFIAPLMVYLLSVYSAGITIIRENATEELSQLQEALKNQLLGKDKINSKTIAKSNKILAKAERKVQTKIALLSPKEQIYRIFTTLLAALLFIMLHMLEKDPYFHIYNHYVSIGLLILSFCSFGYGMHTLRQVAWICIDTKEEIAKRDKEKEEKEKNPGRIIISTGIGK